MLNPLSKLSRVTNPGRTFIPQIDGLRFIAIMAVIACHAHDFILHHHGLEIRQSADLVERTFEAGRYGVQLFFAISGFILALPFAKQMLSDAPSRLRLKEYYLRRITRIEPPYVIHLIFLFLLSALVFRHLPPEAHYSLSQNPHWLGYVSSHLFASLFYSSGFIFGGHPLNIVLWSLEIEVQFYIVAPLLAQVFRISSAWKRRSIIAAAMIAAPIFSVGINRGIFSHASLLAHIQYFLAGFLLVDLYLTKTFSFTARGFKWDLVSLAALASIVFIGRGVAWSSYLFSWVILAGCLAGFHGRIGSWFLSRPLIATIGGMCYTIYMYHYHLLSMFMRFAAPFETHILWLDFWIQFFIVTIPIVLVCSVLFAFLERPFMRRDWPTRFWAFIRGKGIGADSADLPAQPAEVPAER
jgi:peptidoglycan/LPS O-acetylase OafA/YrhL